MLTAAFATKHLPDACPVCGTEHGYSAGRRGMGAASGVMHSPKELTYLHSPSAPTNVRFVHMPEVPPKVSLTTIHAHALLFLHSSKTHGHSSLSPVPAASKSATKRRRWVGTIPATAEPCLPQTRERDSLPQTLTEKSRIRYLFLTITFI